MTREDILQRLQELNLIEIGQITQAQLTQYSMSMPADGYPVCELRLTGIGRTYESDIVSIRVMFDGKVVKTAEVPVVTGESDKYRVKVGSDVISRYVGRKVECLISVSDKYGRDLVSSSAYLQVGEEKKNPVFRTEVVFSDSVNFDDKTASNDFVKGNIVCNNETTVCLELESSGSVLWQNNVNLMADTLLPFTVSLDSVQIPDDGNRDITFNVISNGAVVFSETHSVCVMHEISEPQQEMSIYHSGMPDIIGDVLLPDFVDVHTVMNDVVPIGSLLLCNRGSDTDVFVSIVLGGSNLLLSRYHLFGDEKEIDLSAPFSMLACDETCSREMVARVTDSEGNVVLHKIVTLKVRSKYDMNLNEICIRTAQFINPRNLFVENLIHNSDSLLATAMGGRYSVYGYQHSGEYVVKQMKAIYDMLYNIKMRYVSDTFTFNKSKSYQHVMTPDRVLEGRCGNCIELCIVYASLLEAMGLEAVVAFPPGHAVIGVVLGTDLYPSNAAYTEKEEVPYVSLKINGKHADVMFVETTACPWDDDFVDAVCLAYDTITKNQSVISDNDNIVFVKKMRLRGIDPIIGL